VKQHSVNCIPAALYAMTRYDPELFPPETAEAFADLLFSAPPPAPQSGRPANYKVRPCAAPRTKLPSADTAEIKAHIVNLYRHFLAQGKNAKNWEDPLLEFLRQLPKR
jgi:hypothetical protein